jgi:vacuolar-type H+-ATPase subunit B/Vma2
MGMRPTHQRQLGARRCARVGAEASRARQVIAALVWAHEESIALVRTLLLTHERADGRQSNADRTGALAAANPADHWANDRAIEAPALADAAHLAEKYAADKWASHVMHLHGLIAMTDELYCNPVPTPGSEGPTAAAATAPARFRSRGDCLGRPG